MNKWITKYPTKPGYYWFYGYRYGKFFGKKKNKPELMFIEVSKIINGLLVVANGQVMYESEIEEAHFMVAKLPEFPKLEGE